MDPRTLSHYQQIGRAFAEEAQSDTVGLWSIARLVKEELTDLDAAAARRVTLDIVREALSKKRVVAGEFVDQDEDNAAFVPLGLSADDAVARVEREWLALGREPNLGEVAWFVAPSLLPVTAQRHPMGKGWKPQSAR